MSQKTYLIIPDALVLLLQITLLHVQFVKKSYMNRIKHVQHTQHDAVLKFDIHNVIFFIFHTKSQNNTLRAAF